MTVYEMKRNDTRPYPDAVLKYADGSLPALGGAVVKFIARYQGSTEIKIEAPAIVTSIATASVEYRPTPADTDTEGLFDVEWEVTFADGTVMTWPTRGYDLLTIRGDLG